jgi:hypothetical protein
MQFDAPNIETQYKKYIANLPESLPEGIVDVNIELLHRFNLLHYHSIDKEYRPVTRYFQVNQTAEKITLINDQFVVWIVPDKVDNTPITYTLIALKNPEQLSLEVAFSTWGIYNNSRLVLRVLEKFLYEIQENEKVLNSLKKFNSF